MTGSNVLQRWNSGTGLSAEWQSKRENWQTTFTWKTTVEHRVYPPLYSFVDDSCD